MTLLRGRAVIVWLGERSSVRSRELQQYCVLGLPDYFCLLNRTQFHPVKCKMVVRHIYMSCIGFSKSVPDWVRNERIHRGETNIPICCKKISTPNTPHNLMLVFVLQPCSFNYQEYGRKSHVKYFEVFKGQCHSSLLWCFFLIPCPRQVGVTTFVFSLYLDDTYD